MSLSDEFFKGLEFGTNFVRSARNQRDEEARRRIVLDASQMQLEDDILTREARLNNAIAKLDNEGSLANQQRRFREALEQQQFLNEQAALAASTSQNLTTRQVNDQARAIGDATYPQRLSTAVLNSNADAVNAATGVTVAGTNQIYADAQSGAARDNRGVIQSTYGTQIQTAGTLADTGLVTAQQQQEQIKRTQETVMARENIMKQAVTAAGSTDRNALITALETMAEDIQNDTEKQIMARSMAEELKSGGDQNTAVNPMIRVIETNPVQLAEQMGMQVVGQADNGDILVQEGKNIYALPRAAIQASMARTLGIDAKPYEELAKSDATSRSKALHGDNLAATLGIGATPGRATISNEGQLNRAVGFALKSEGYRLGSDGIWYAPTNEPLTRSQFQTLREVMARRYGYNLTDTAGTTAADITGYYGGQ